MAFVQLKKCLTEPKHLVKLVALVICVCITIYQLSGCVEKILQPPVTSNYNFLMNDTVKYPAVTICRKPSYKIDAFPLYGLRSEISSVDMEHLITTTNFFEDFFFDNSTIENFLTETTFDFKNTVALYAYRGVGMGPNIIMKSFFLLKKGQCHTIIPTENSDTFSVEGGYMFYLKHTAKEKTKDNNGLSTSGFEIYIHSENQVLSDFANDFMEYLYVESSEEMQVTLSLETYSYISTSQNPCVSEPEYSKSLCQEKCIHNFIASEAGCTLPWLRNLDKHYPQCSNYSMMALFIDTFTGDRNIKTALQRCNCQNNCNYSVYKYLIQSRYTAETVPIPSSKINIYFSRSLISVVSQVISYDWNVFVSDVGGSLGFLLGLSVIGIITVAEEVIKIFFGAKSDKEQIEQIDEKSNGGQNLKDLLELMVQGDKREHEEVDKNQQDLLKY